MRPGAGSGIDPNRRFQLDRSMRPARAVVPRKADTGDTATMRCVQVMAVLQ